MQQDAEDVEPRDVEPRESSRGSTVRFNSAVQHQYSRAVSCFFVRQTQGWSGAIFLSGHSDRRLKWRQRRTEPFRRLSTLSGRTTVQSGPSSWSSWQATGSLTTPRTPSAPRPQRRGRGTERVLARFNSAAWWPHSHQRRLPVPPSQFQYSTTPTLFQKYGTRIKIVFNFLVRYGIGNAWGEWWERKLKWGFRFLLAGIFQVVSRETEKMLMRCGCADPVASWRPPRETQTPHGPSACMLRNSKKQCAKVQIQYVKVNTAWRRHRLSCRLPIVPARFPYSTIPTITRIKLPLHSTTS